MLRRLGRDARETSLGGAIPSDGAPWEHEYAAWLPAGSKLCGEASGELFLLELSVPTQKVVASDPRSSDLAQWLGAQLWPDDEESQALFTERFVVLSDDLFGFLTRTATELRSRVKIDDETGTAAGSGSWTEEHLPAETLLHGVALGRTTRYFPERTTQASASSGEAGVTKSKDTGEAISADGAISVLDGLLRGSPTLRFGGKSSTGMGRARMTLAGGKP